MFSAVTLVTMSRLRANVRAGMHRKGQAIATHLVLSQSQCFASAARSMTYQVPVPLRPVQLKRSPSDRRLYNRADCISALNSVAAPVTGHSPAFAHDRSSLDGVLLTLPVSSGLGDSDRMLQGVSKGGIDAVIASV